MSYKLLSARLDTIEGRVEALDDKLDVIVKKLDEISTQFTRTDFADLRTFCERADEGWESKDSETKWKEAASGLHGLQNKFSSQIERLVSAGSTIDVIMPFADAMALAGSTRVACTLALGERKLALRQASDFAIEFRAHLEPVSVARLIEVELATRRIRPEDTSFANEAQKLEPALKGLVGNIREREECAASLPLTIERVLELDLDGREFLEAARSEKDTTLLMLKGDE